MLNLNKPPGNKSRRQEIKPFTENKSKSASHMPLKPFTESWLTEEQSTQTIIPFFGEKSLGSSSLRQEHSHTQPWLSNFMNDFK